VDRGRTFAALLIALAGLTGAAADSPVHEARWLAPGKTLAALTRQPAECVKWPANPDQRRSVGIGRIAFRTPNLLGGQAARARLSCASCHRNGRSNPDFLFPGLSGAPGTADVTSSLMSKTRGDGMFNPKPIPDLAGSPSLFKISRDPATETLERFITGLIVDEFDGHAPPPAVLAGLAAYVRALAPDRCSKEAASRVTMASLMTLALEASDIALLEYQRGDRATTQLMLSGARVFIGQIDERYGGTALARDRKITRDSDQALYNIARAVDAGSSEVPHLIDNWQQQSSIDSVVLSVDEKRSLFSLARLSRAQP
jgi:hypothetical protein